MSRPNLLYLMHLGCAILFAVTICFQPKTISLLDCRYTFVYIYIYMIQYKRRTYMNTQNKKNIQPHCPAESIILWKEHVFESCIFFIAIGFFYQVVYIIFITRNLLVSKRWAFTCTICLKTSQPSRMQFPLYMLFFFIHQIFSIKYKTFIHI